MNQLDSSAGKRTVRSSKSRSGCQTCKARRIKCDEAKPSCQNCMSRSWQCPGYATVIKWDAKRHFAANASFDGTTGRRAKPVRTRNAPVEQENTSTKIDSGRQKAALPTEVLLSCHPDLGTTVDDLLSSPSTDKTDNHRDVERTHDGAIDLDGMQDYTSEFDFNTLSTSSSQLIIRSPIYSQTQSLTSRHTARALLRNFYAFNAITPSLTFTGTHLVDYYFSTICRLYSCFDSTSNPFRASVAKVWTSSASTYYAIQSMAAAYLANTIPSMRRQGLILHQKAADHLVEEIQMTKPGFEGSLMTLLLLGMSACWQRAEDLGMPYLRTARRLMNGRLWDLTFGVPVEENPVVTFFEEALVYWEMTAAFVSDDHVDTVGHGFVLDENMTYGPELDLNDHGTQTKVTPHAWTGVSPQSQMLLAEVGRYLRKVRNNLMTDEEVLATSLQLEERLLSLEELGMDDLTISHTADEVNHARDLISLAKVTRQCGLLQLYRTCPGVLRRRLGTDLASGQMASTRCLCTLTQSWITNYAISILEMLEMIPASSSVRVHQLLPLLLAACELRSPLLGMNEHDTVFESDTDVQTARNFVRTRFEQLAIQLPARPIRVMQKLVDEVWMRFDLGNGLCDDVFWLDIMTEKGYETIMG